MSHSGDYELARESLRARNEGKWQPALSVPFSHLPRWAALGQWHSLADPQPNTLRRTQVLASLEIRSGAHPWVGVSHSLAGPCFKTEKW